ncbi:MAG: hypothetical protein NC548_54770 [Lachnospiraceae bacterium]|nr:hypothetical protein [Lachnospiraceae bacterium]
MNSLSIISDSVAHDEVKNLISTFSDKIELSYLGTLHTLSDGYSEDVILNELKTIISKNNMPIVAITSSGNSVAIYANKLGIATAPIFDLQSLMEAIEKYECRIFDISTSNDNILTLLQTIKNHF